MELKTNFIKCEMYDLQTPQMQEFISNGKAEVFDVIAVQSIGSLLPYVSKKQGKAVCLSVDFAENLAPCARIKNLLQQIRPCALRMGFTFPRELTCGYGVPNAYWTMPVANGKLDFTTGQLGEILTEVKEKNDISLEVLVVSKSKVGVTLAVEFNPYQYWNDAWNFKRWQQALFAFQSELGVPHRLNAGAYFPWY